MWRKRANHSIGWVQELQSHWEKRELCELVDLRELREAFDRPEVDLLALRELRELAFELRDPKKPPKPFPLNIVFAAVVGWDRTW